MKMIKRIDQFIPERIQRDYGVLNRARLIIASSMLLILLMVFVLIPPIIVKGAIGMLIIYIFCATLFAAAIMIMKKTGSIQISGFSMMVVGYSLITISTINSGGIDSDFAFGYTAVIMFAFLLTGLKAGIGWSVAVFSSVAVLNVLKSNGLELGSLDEGMARIMILISTLSCALIIALLFELSGKNTQNLFLAEKDLAQKTSDNQKKLLENSLEVMEAVAAGDFSKVITVDVEGELNRLKDAINRATEMLSQTMVQVVEGSSNMLTASLELNKASQTLADGNSQQAASLEEISSSINEIDGVAKTNREGASQAQQLSDKATRDIDHSNQQMELMLASMGQISETSNNVSKVIKVIDEIAFQTNLLALNAAVEAARAGKYGKGFAVVAEEVRNLASRSSVAAKDTTSLIESAISEVETGVKIAHQTAKNLRDFMVGTEKVNDLVGDITAASNEQSLGVSEVSKGLEMVNEVVQRNSAISEETSSAASELKSQAESMQQTVNRFKLKRSVSGYEKEVSWDLPEKPLSSFTSKASCTTEPFLMMEDVTGGNWPAY